MMEYKKVVTVTPARLGDTIFTLPALHLFKKANPDVQFDVITTTPLSAAVIKNNPYFDNIYSQPNMAELEKCKDYYDLAINIHDSDYARQCFETLNATTVGPYALCETEHTARLAHNFIRNFFAKDYIDEEQHYQLFPTDTDRNKVKSVLAEQGVNLETDLLIGAHIGCHGLARKRTRLFKKSVHKKVWPLTSYMKLFEELKGQYKNLKFVITGSKEEEKLGEEFQSKYPEIINLINKTSIQEMVSLIDLLKVYVTPDTGALHVACATNTNVVALFGPTFPLRSGPFPQADNRIILQEKVISELPVERVVNTIKTFVE